MRLRVRHETVYEYDELVTTSHHEIHLTPRDGASQVCLSHKVTIQPEPETLHERIDYFDNRACYFGIHEPHRTLEIVAESDVRVEGYSRSLILDRTSWEEVRDLVARSRRAESLEAYSFVFDSPYVRVQPELRSLATPSFAPGRSMLDAALDLTRRIFSGFTYERGATGVSTPLSEVLRDRRGVCQDFAHVAIGCLRSLGLPARYVSGYLLTAPPPGRPRLTGCDASHAWISTYLPNLGWIDFDPSNDMMADEGHVVVAYGRDFGDVTPVRGVILGGGHHALRVAVDVAPLEDDAAKDRP
jgi:transglutaminase-like putative cysteine protease